MKYRIVQNDIRNNKTGYPVKEYHIQYLKVVCPLFRSSKTKWKTYSYSMGRQFSFFPRFNTIKKAKKYITGLRQELVKNKIVK